MKGLAGLALGAFGAVVIACAASHKSAVQPVAPPSSAGGVQPMPGEAPQHDEIDQLAREIETQRVQMGLPVPAQAHAVEMATATCHRSEADSCKQTCTLTDSICTNAKKICDLASQLANDAWAAQKCSDGNDTCNNAKARCCACT